MLFENNLNTYNFNKDTMNLLVEDGLSKDEIIETMKTVGFSTELTEYLLSVQSTFYNSVMIRLKLYAKQNRDVKYIKNALNKFTETYSLVEHLFNDDNLVTDKNTTVSVEEEDTVSLLDENIINENSEEEEDPLQSFYDKFIVKDEGANLSYKESYAFFVNWFNENHDEEDETPGKKQFKKYLSDKLGKSNKNLWKDYSLNVNA